MRMLMKFRSLLVRLTKGLLFSGFKLFSCLRLTLLKHFSDERKRNGLNQLK